MANLDHEWNLEFIPILWIKCLLIAVHDNCDTNLNAHSIKWWKSINNNAGQIVPVWEDSGEMPNKL